MSELYRYQGRELPLIGSQVTVHTRAVQGFSPMFAIRDSHGLLVATCREIALHRARFGFDEDHDHWTVTGMYAGWKAPPVAVSTLRYTRHGWQDPNLPLTATHAQKAWITRGGVYAFGIRYRKLDEYRVA